MKPGLSSRSLQPTRRAGLTHLLRTEMMKPVVWLWLLCAPTGAGGALVGAMRTGVPVMLGRVYTANDRVTFIDGNNLMATRKVTKGRDALAAQLSGCRGREVVVVFDGKVGEQASTSGTDPVVVVTRGGAEDGSYERETADQWISRELERSSKSCAEVVTGDRVLRRVAHACKAKCINPAKFWRRYLPRLKGLKNDYANEPKKGTDA